MRYILGEVRGVERLTAVSFGGLIECGGTSCTEYTGTTPTGYTSLGQWYEANTEQLWRWTVNADGDLELLAAPGEEPQGSTVSLSSGVWNYSRRPDGRIELWGDIALSFSDSTETGAGAHRSIVALDLSDVLTKVLAGSCPYQSAGLHPVVCRNGTTPSTAEVIILAPASFSAFSDTVPVYIMGI